MNSYAESLQVCRRITQASRSNFTAAFRFLPPAKREGMEVLYAYMRRTDDLADGDFDGLTLPNETRRELLERWRTALEDAWGRDGDSEDVERREGKGETGKGGDFRNHQASGSDAAKTARFFAESLRIFPALRGVGRQFHLPLSSLLDVIDGVLSDLNGPVRLETENDAFLYCDRVAGAVGLAVLAILGTNRPLEDAQLRDAALACGRAFQWTNFLRDLREDILDRGRLYFPLDDFRRLAWRPEDLYALVQKGRTGRALLKLRLADSYDPLTRFLTIQWERTERFYRDSSILNEMIPADSLPVFQMMRRVYYALFQKISRRREQIFEKRIRLSAFEKLNAVLSWGDKKI